MAPHVGAYHDTWEAAKALATLFRPLEECERLDVLTGAYLLALHLRAARIEG